MEHQVLLSILFMLFVVFTTAKLAGLLFKRFGFPSLIGEIIVGVLITNVMIGDQTIASMLDIVTTPDSVNLNILAFLAELGVIFLLFSVGLNTRVKDMLSLGKVALLVALFGVLIPLALGFLYVYYFYDPENLGCSLFLGAAMVATSVGITAQVIKSLGVTKSKEAKIIISAAVIDDILGMVVLSIVVGITGSGLDLARIMLSIIIAVVFVVIMMFLAIYVIPWMNKRYEDNLRKKKEANPYYKPVKINHLVVIVVACLLFSYIAELINLASIIGAFFAGMLFAEFADKRDFHRQVEVVCELLVTFFFVVVGLNVDFAYISKDIVVVSVVVIILAILGKYLGCALGAKIGDKKMDKSSLNIIGVGMVPRGEVGIVVASIGLTTGVLYSELYTIVVLMSVLTTLIAPPILQHLFLKKYAPKSEDTDVT